MGNPLWSRLVLMVVALVGPAVVHPALVHPALAQQRPTPTPAPGPAPAAAPAPDRTSSQFGDWTLACAGPSATRQCELTQTVQDRQRQASAVVALGKPRRDAPPRLAVRVPGVVLVGTPLKLVLEPTETLVLPYRLCGPNGCLAELELRDEALVRRLQARPADRSARVEWRDGGNNEAAFNLSFRGFAAALDALGREAR